MVKWFVDIKEDISALNIPANDAIMPTIRTSSEIRSFYNIFKQYKSVTKEPQKDHRTIQVAHAWFDILIEFCASNGSRLTKNADIVSQLHLKSVIIKIQSNICEDLKDLEGSSARHLLNGKVQVKLGSEESSELSLEERARKYLKLSAEDLLDKYLDLRIILPSSNLFERFFSKAVHVDGINRGTLDPVHLVAQMFLHAKSESDLPELNSNVKKFTDMEE